MGTTTQDVQPVTAKKEPSGSLNIEKNPRTCVGGRNRRPEMNYKRTLCRVTQTGGKDQPVKVYTLARNNQGITLNFQWIDLPNLVLDHLMENNFDTFFCVQVTNINTDEPLIEHSTWEHIILTSACSTPTHCCLEHSCMYGKPDCPIENGTEEQVYDCDQETGYKQQQEKGPKTDPSPDPRSLRELLAALEHDQWAHWTKYMLDLLQDDLEVSSQWDGAPYDGKELFQRLVPVIRWRRQIKMPYDQLTEAEKDSDREWADKILILLAKEDPQMTLPEGWIERATALLTEIGIELPFQDTPASQLDVSVSSTNGVQTLTNVAVATAWSTGSLITSED